MKARLSVLREGTEFGKFHTGAQLDVAKNIGQLRISHLGLLPFHDAEKAIELSLGDLPRKKCQLNVIQDVEHLLAACNRAPGRCRCIAKSAGFLQGEKRVDRRKRRQPSKARKPAPLFGTGWSKA